MLEKRHRSDAGVPAPPAMVDSIALPLLFYAVLGSSDRDIIRPLALPSLLYYSIPFRYVYKKKHLTYHAIMNCSTTLTQEEYAALLQAMEKAGFTDESAYLHYAVMQAVCDTLSAM